MSETSKFSHVIGPVAIHFYGEPNRAMSSTTELRFGKHGSLSVDLEKATWFDHEQQVGGGFLDMVTLNTKCEGREAVEYVRKLGYDLPDDDNYRPPRNGGGNGPKAREPREEPPPWEPPNEDRPPPRMGREVAFYDYVDEAGSLIFQVVRFEPKTFRQRRRDALGGWVYSVKGVRLVPYRLPELIEAVASERVVYIVEGEKDCDRLAGLGIVATCNAGGCGKWREEYNHHFEGADVVVIQDNDPQARKKDGTLHFHQDGRPVYPGQDHARHVCQELSKIAGRVRLVDLKADWPGMPPKGDVSDWLDSGATRDQLDKIVADLPEWSPEMPGPKAELPKITFIIVPEWQGQPVPQREWIVEGRIPVRNVTLLSGQGGIGKTLIAQQLAIATVLGRGWVDDRVIDPGPVIFLNCEDDADEIHFRLANIIAHYNCEYTDLADFHPVSFVGAKETALGVVSAKGTVEPTNVFHALEESAMDIRPRWIGIDTAADVFICNENDRSQARQCINMLRGLCLRANTTILLLAHPSLSGISSGSGMSGSTGWSNSVRSRLYLHVKKKTKDEKEEEQANGGDEVDENDVRLLETMKANYSDRTKTIRLKWRNGLLLPEGTVDSLAGEKVRPEVVDAMFLMLLDRFIELRKDQGATPKTSVYAPILFAKEAEARARKINQYAFEQSMNRLLVEKKIHIVLEGPPSKKRKRLAMGRAMELTLIEGGKGEPPEVKG